MMSSCPKTLMEPQAGILEAFSKFAGTSRHGTGSVIGEPEQTPVIRKKEDRVPPDRLFAGCSDLQENSQKYHCHRQKKSHRCHTK